MKYTLTIDIDLPRQKVIELFDDPDNLKHWQEGFISLEPVSGKPGEVGAKSRLQYRMGKRKIEMIETITSRNLPLEFSGAYEAPGVWNEVRNFFEEIDGNRTRWRSEVEFRFQSFFMKMMGFLMPGAFRKQSFKYMSDFKKFAEGR